MKKLLIIKLIIFASFVWSCGGIDILNATGFELNVGYDLRRLKPIDNGSTLHLEKRDRHALHIKSAQQNCMYEVLASIELKKLRNQQFIVKENGVTIEPKVCQ